MYRFTRVFGGVIAALGWVVLLGAPILSAVVGVAAGVLAPGTRPTVNPNLLVGVSTLLGLIVGLVVGGGLIVGGQLLRIAVDIVNFQGAMIERLDELAAPQRVPGRAEGGRFAGLSGE